MLRRISAVGIICILIFTSFIGVTGFSGSRGGSRDFFEVETVIKGGRIGYYTSLALDSNDNPHVSYQFMGDLRYSNYNGSSWNVHTIEYDKYMGEYPSIDIDSNDYPRIAYIGFDEVMCANWDGNSWDLHSLGYSYPTYKETSMVIDNADKCHIIFYRSDYNNLYYVTYKGYVQKNFGIVENVGYLWGSAYPSIDVDNNDFPQISYYDNDNDDLKYAKWNGASWDIEIVDSNGNVGLYSSIAIDKNGYPHISYYDQTNQDLKYAKWNGNSWNITTVDSAGEVGESTSLKLDMNGYAHISYYDYTNRDLKYANWTGTSWDNYTIDSEGSVGTKTSIALDSYGYPHISYLDYTNDDIKYAKWTGTVWVFDISDGGDGIVGHSSMVLDNNGYRHISYHDLTNYNLKYGMWNGTSWNIENVDDDVGAYNSITLDSNGYPHISYFDSFNDNIKYAKWTGSTWDIQVVDSNLHCRWGGTWTSIDVDSKDNPQIIYYYNVSDRLHLKSAKWTGSAWDIQTIEAMCGGWYCEMEMSGPGVFASLKIDSNDKAHIAYYNWSIGDLKYANWTGTSWNVQTIDQLDYVGQYPSLDLDNNDYPHISYYDATDGDLKYASWDGSVWSNITVDSTDTVGFCTSLVLDNNDIPQISYFDYTNKAVKYARCTGSTWNIEIIDSEYYEYNICDITSIDIDNYGYAHICYQGNTDHYITLNYAVQTAIDQSLPGAPTLLSTTPGNGQATIFWNAPSFNGGLPIINYKIYRGTEPGKVNYRTTVEAVLSFTDTGLTNDVEYFYKVSAVNSLGEGPQSDMINVTPSEEYTYWAPGTPIGLQTKSGNSYVQLSWKAPLSNGGSPIINYNIYKNKTSGHPEFLCQIGNVTGYNDTAVTNGITYYYQISAVNAIGEGPLSIEVSATPQGTIFPFTGNILYVGGSGPGNYTRIQDAIDDAFNGDSVFVFDDKSPYYENLMINKTIKLIGENKENTVISWHNTSENIENVIDVKADQVYINEITVINSEMLGAGIYVHSLSNITISNCILQNNGIGIYLENNSYNNIFNCELFNNVIGIYFWGSSYNTLRDNTIYNNTHNIGFFGYYYEHYYQDIDFSNAVNNKPIYYLMDQSNLTLDGAIIDIGYLALISCENIIIKNVQISNNSEGILLVNASDINIWNATIKANSRGIDIVGGTSNVSISNCNISDNRIGIDLGWHSTDIIISKCNISNNKDEGICISFSSNNTIMNSTISNNDFGIEIIYESLSNSIINCIISDNNIGINIIDKIANDNLAYNNLFINNTLQARSQGNNFWDDGARGNYWDDYTGTDSNGDGIGDSPYIIEVLSNIDNYPLMEPWDIRTEDPMNIEITLTLDKPEFYLGENITGSVHIQNNNPYQVYLNDILFQTMSGDIDPSDLGVYFHVSSLGPGGEFEGFYNYPSQIIVEAQSSLVIDFTLNWFEQIIGAPINDNLTTLNIGNYSIYTYFYYGEFPFYDIINSNTVNFRIVGETSPPPRGNGGDGGSGSGTDDLATTIIFTSVTGLVFLIIILTFFATATELGKYKFASMFAAPLYSRELKKRKRKGKELYLRGKIHGYILGNPGDNYTAIKTKLSLTNGALAYHLKVLERNKEVRSERDGVLKRFYPYEGKVTSEILELSKLQKRILNVIKKNPGVTQTRISKNLDISVQKVNYHIRLMEDARIIRLERDKNKTRVYVVD